MIPVFIVLFGALLIIAAIVGLRLPAFLALIGAALLVVSITPAEIRLRSAARPSSLEVESVSPEGVTLTRATRAKATSGAYRLLPRNGAPSGSVHFTAPEKALGPGAPGKLDIKGENLSLVPGDLLVPEAEWAAANKAAGQNPGEVVAHGFGATTASIGLLIALASIIGACLMESGAAERIVIAIRNVLGEKRASLGFIPSGFLLCIPAFFDTVFYLLMPLGKAMRIKTGRDYLLYILCVVAGATMAHSLVPPTPGPSFVAAALQINVATMMLAGSIVGLIAALAGYLYALWANKRWEIPLRDSTLPEEGGALEVQRRLPNLAFSLIPILLPIALIAVDSLTDPKWQSPLRSAISLFGNKNMALAVGAASALFLLASMREWKWRTLAKPLNVALEGAGVVLLITPAGGAFGHALRSTDVAGVLSSWISGGGFWLLPAAFGVTMLVRLAQGSATVAMITGVGIVGPIALSVPLGFHPVYIALAIGCGSKPIPWMNDSGFWIISKMTGMTELETLKTASAMMAVMGFTGLGVTLLGAWLLPFV